LEDDADWADAMRSAFEAIGFTVQAVHTLAEAGQRITRQRYTALIVDMQISRTEGAKIIEQARTSTHGFNYETPILVVSGTLDTERLERIRGKVQGVLVKPVAATEVTARTQALARAKPATKGAA
jgi:DNA-binding response OmpR family regulator